MQLEPKQDAGDPKRAVCRHCIAKGTNLIKGHWRLSDYQFDIEKQTHTCTNPLKVYIENESQYEIKIK